MDQPMSKEESYADRRKLFKNIWETSIQIDEKDDIMNRPKIIKTLRLDEMDRCTAEKKKKQRIKNLRHVCNKLLDFCDRQDADDMFYEQMAAQGKKPISHLMEPKVKKKRIKTRKVHKKAKNVLSSSNTTATAKVTLSEMKDDIKACTKIATNKIKRTSISLPTSKTMKLKQSNKILMVKSGNSEVASKLPMKRLFQMKRIKNKPELK